MNTGWYIDTVTLYQLSCTGTSDNIYIAQLYMNFPWGEQVVLYTYWKFFSTSLQMNMCCFIHAATLYHFLFVEHVMIDFLPQLDINFPVDKDVIINIYIMQLDINFLVHTETVRITTFWYRKLHSTIRFVVYYVETRLPSWEFFHVCALLSPLTFLTGDHVQKSDLTDLAFHFVDMRYGYEITVDEHVMIYTYRNFISFFMLINTWWYILVATL